MGRAITLGSYYLCLALMRAFLSHHIQRRKKHGASNAVLCRRCGLAIMALVLPVSGMVVLNVNDQGTFSRPGIIAIGTAACAFTKLGMGIYNFVRYRDGSHPLMLAITHVSLAGRFATLLTMGILLLDAYSGEAASVGKRLLLTCGMGAETALAIAVVRFSLVWRSRRMGADAGPAEAAELPGPSVAAGSPEPVERLGDSEV